jgi:hypothetical protein
MKLNFKTPNLSVVCELEENKYQVIDLIDRIHELVEVLEGATEDPTTVRLVISGNQEDDDEQYLSDPNDIGGWNVDGYEVDVINPDEITISFGDDDLK